MAKDFIRIGGEIVSAPLNENFRRLRNDISVANANLVFSDTDGIKNTLDDMYSIEEPENAQVCYVVSSGEMYRYATGDHEWHKIMDIGQTFRQGFLNSGAVVLEGNITLKAGSLTTLVIPRMLVYFKNKAGDSRYLKGMYLLEEAEVDIESKISGANAYSILTDELGNYTIDTGMPKTDVPSKVYLGTFLVDNDGHIIPDFIYTLPDMAYTADRGHFLMQGGQAEGCNLGPGNNGAQVSRAAGFYYDEGINFPVGLTENFPIDTDNGANFDLKAYDAEDNVSKLFYMTPYEPLENGLRVSENGLIVNKYWDNENKRLADVPKDRFTIQQHLVTPNGQNIILYGTVLYNSITDAVSNLNSQFGLTIYFPYVEATRIVVGNVDEFDTDKLDCCQFFTLGHLSQIGTITPEFSDSAFRLYSGDANDTTPSSLRFLLGDLQPDENDDVYNLAVLPYNGKRKLFYGTSKYIKDDDIVETITEEDKKRKVDHRGGYYIADNNDLNDALARIDALEQEIWAPHDSARERWEQSARYRLFTLEQQGDSQAITLADHKTRLETLEDNRVRKETSINNYALGDLTDPSVIKAIVLETGDIQEGYGKGSVKNEWYTDGKVASHPDVVKGVEHAGLMSDSEKGAIGHIKVNPHNISTDDINVLTDTRKVFVSPEQEMRIRADYLPDNTKEVIKNLEESTLKGIGIDYYLGNSTEPGEGPFHLGSIKNIQFFQDGVDLSLSEDGESLLVEVLGQMDEDTVMFKHRYATLEIENPDEYGGYVDNAINAEYASFVGGVEEATANQYYGTDELGTVGIFDLPGRVTTATKDDFGNELGDAEIDKITFELIPGLVEREHLSDELYDDLKEKYQVVYDGGELRSATIDTFKFGNNLEVTVSGTTATINATGEGGSVGEVSFANLKDVDVTYTGAEGKVLVVNDKGTGVTLGNLPSVDEYMLKGVYVDKKKPSYVKQAILADTATLALKANNSLAVNDKVVDDTKTTNAYLWTASKIISNTSSQIASEGVNTYSGTTVPSDSLGKNGDIYILIEG